MGFTFQTNQNIRFKTDAEFLRKADELRPALNYEKVRPVRLLGLSELSEQDMLCGPGSQKSQNMPPLRDDDLTIGQLDSYEWKRGDTFILDFGRHCVGRFSASIDAVGSPMDAPLFLRIRFAEIPAELGMDASKYDGWLSKSWIQEEFVHLDELPARLELPRRYSFRYVQVTVIDTSSKWRAVFSHPLVTAETSAQIERYRKIDVQDPELENICDVAVRTLSECMQDVFEDGPKRDRRLWLGDLRLQALADYASFDQTDLVKRCLYLFAAMTTEDGRIPANVFVKPQNRPDDTFLFDYSLFFISTLYDYMEHHPEESLLRDMYPVCKAQMDISLSYVDAKGQLVLSDDYPVFIDWSDQFDKTTAGQGVLIYCLRRFLELAEQAGDTKVSGYRNALVMMESYARDHLLDRNRMLFASGPDREYNLASQVWMVLSGALTEEEQHAVMSHAADELLPGADLVTPYMCHHIAEALFEAGLSDEAVKLIKDYWGGMIRLGADTYWEVFDPREPDYSPYGSPVVSSYCHAWGCTPIYLLRKYLH